MTVCGITAEYNPFHTGHLHHIAETRRSLGENAVIVCVMSGNFVQRGDFAVLDKYARAEMAVRCGADLVVELPLAAALSSAEGFAKGAVQTLHALGCGTVSFGAETADTDLLLQAAELLNSLPMKGESGSPHLSYAARRQEELSKVNKQAAVLLDNPNNTLAVEYCRFLLPLGMRPLAVLRQGAAHDNAHGIFDIGLLHLRHQRRFHDSLFRIPDLLGVILGFFTHFFSSLGNQ